MAGLKPLSNVSVNAKSIVRSQSSDRRTRWLPVDSSFVCGDKRLRRANALAYQKMIVLTQMGEFK